jgi:hypothetical protein
MRGKLHIDRIAACPHNTPRQTAIVVRLPAQQLRFDVGHVRFMPHINCLHKHPTLNGRLPAQHPTSNRGGAHLVREDVDHVARLELAHVHLNRQGACADHIQSANGQGIKIIVKHHHNNLFHAHLNRQSACAAPIQPVHSRQSASSNGHCRIRRRQAGASYCSGSRASHAPLTKDSPTQGRSRRKGGPETKAAPTHADGGRHAGADPSPPWC